ncbi:VTT domain-containing protein [Caenispirillum salinarum]|nr:VTT domain-containing protein [Caenispirillum salinarum]
MSQSPAAAPRLLDRPGVAWRVETADRAALLVDAAAYFRELRRALLRAERQVLLVGWDVDGRTDVVGPEGGPEPGDDAPRLLRELLTWLVEHRPDLNVHVLLWDYTLLYALDREPLPTVTLGWTTPDRVHLHLDDSLPMEASHHEKVVVIDDALAFCGGMDVTIRRWDTPEHRLDDPRRRDPGGEAYPPVHDAALMVDGAAARALGDLARERWHHATGRRLHPVPRTAGRRLWPDDLPPRLRSVSVGISRTRPAGKRWDAVREVCDLYCAAIEGAERTLYIENQYLTADCVADALVRRLRETPDLEVVMVGPRTAMDWLEETTMGVGRATFMARLAETGAGDRIRLLAPVIRDDAGESHDVKVHSKLMIVDDRVMTIGSANLANRSMGLDTETNTTVEATRQEDRDALARWRDGLLAEHLGCPREAVAGALVESGGSLVKAVDALTERNPARTLVPVDASLAEPNEGVALLNRIGDPEEPIDLDRFLAEQVPEPPVGPSRKPLSRHLWTGFFIVAVIAAVVALWELTPLREGLDPRVFYDKAVALRGLPWTPLAVLGGYVALGLAAFPITVLITVTAMVFGPVMGFVYASSGAILSAVISFGLGHLLGKRLVRRYAGATVNRLSEALGRRGIVAVVFLRVAPVAPFLIINLVSGASHVRFRDYILGTLLGMLPGIAVMTLLGSSIMGLIQDPTPARIIVLVGCLVLWFLVSVGLQRLVSRRQKARDRAGRG